LTHPFPVHGGTLGGWHDVPAAWVLDVPVIATIAVAGALYLLGERRRRRRSSHQIAATVALLTLVVALVSPLDSLADRLFAAHMTQHLLLVTVSAPALAICAPWRSWWLLAPRSARTRGARVARWTHRNGWSAAVPATAISIIVLWFWHAPGPYDSAVRHAPIHALEHVLLLSSATWFWATVIREHRRGRTPHALAMLCATGLSGTALGMLLTFTGTVWFSVHPDTASFGLSPLQDQQLAGVIMWVVPGIDALVLMARMFLRWLTPEPKAHTSVRGAS
jgi:cytochrome c oxidase assembly factor CtaG